MRPSEMAPNQSISAASFGTGLHDEVVEIVLLLPTQRAQALVDLSRRRRQSIGQILRGLIDRALTDQD